MTPANIVQKLLSYCNVLRDDGISCGDYVEQLTNLPYHPRWICDIGGRGNRYLEPSCGDPCLSGGG